MRNPKKETLVGNVDDHPIINYHIDREYHPYHGYWTGRFIWEVYEAASGGPIVGGTEDSFEMAAIIGRNARNQAEIDFGNETLVS